MANELTDDRLALMRTVFGDARKNWGWLLGLGILSVILGTIGLGMTPYLTLATVSLFGILLAVGGGFQLADAFKCKGWKGTLLHVLIGLLYLAAGIATLYEPLRAAVALTLLIGAAFIVVGVLRISMAFQHKGARGWGWALAGGIISVILGLLVMSGWPVSGLWFIGLIIAIELIVNGWTYIFLGLAARTAHRASAGERDDSSKGAAHAA
ncbi:MAG: HdeD family acid-resistance protein [Chromatiaceae bacterium]